jgi:arylsulfatase A-like enzyme
MTRWLLLALLGAAGGAQEARPNVLFLFTDDQRADTIRALGNPHVETPNLDRLAESGFAFRNAYCMGGDVPAVCTPSRYMLLSGLLLFHRKNAGPDRPNFPRAMKDAGYFTYHHGKRGNTCPPIQKLFDVDRYVSHDEKERRSGAPGKEIADAAVEFLKTRAKDKPFFMYLAFGNPHDPRVASPEARSKVDDARLPLPANYRPVHPFDNGEMLVRDEQLAAWPRTPEEVRKHLGDYYAVIAQMDAEIGRILQALRDTGEADRTIVVFSSDHGLALGSHGLMGKQNVYEDGLKVPLLLSGPGVPRGRSDAFAYLFDVFPTVCELAGLPAPPGIDGKSLVPVLRGSAASVREAMMLAYRTCQRAARKGDWKVIRYPQIHRTQLFHLKDDPHETKDLSDDPAHAEKAKEMLELLARLQKEYDDDLPLTSPDRKPPEWTPPAPRKNP